MGRQSEDAELVCNGIGKVGRSLGILLDRVRMHRWAEGINLFP